MRKTTVTVDDRQLDQTRQELGVSSTAMSTNRAPRDAMLSDAQRREIKALSVMNGLDLADDHVMANAWRS